ncbi:MAG: WS/DGAT/MGAT family O-acyltransferase [Propionibacteriaceae bacterium]
MPDSLSSLEMSLLALDTLHTPGHTGTVDVFGGDADFDYEHLIGLIRDRIPFVPRYRMRVRTVPLALGPSVWVEDEDFDLTFHVRRSALPRPGTMEQLREFVGRVMARRLDRDRPLWEMYLVEGLQGNRFALVTKSHQALVDGMDTVDIGQVLLDETETPRSTPAESWQPNPEPSAVDLLAASMMEGLQDPAVAVGNARRGVLNLLGVAVTVGEAVGGVGGILGELAGSALRGSRPPAESPLGGIVSEQRRFATVAVPLSDLKAVRATHDHTINDVVLAVVAGGLRAWLLTRGHSMSSAAFTALVPMSVIDSDGEPSSLGSQVAPHLMHLPVGEPNPLMRLHQVSYGTQAHKDTGRAVGARSITDIAGFAPTTLHGLGVRVAQEVVRKQHDLVITNVPGPQKPLYAAGAPLLASYPVIPLGTGHLLAIGVTSYNGQVYFGLTADRDKVSDLDVLAQCLEDSLAELLDTTERAATSRPPTRRAAPRTTPRKKTAKKAPAKKAPVKKTAVKKAPVKKAPAKPAAKKAAEKAPTKKPSGESADD